MMARAVPIRTVAVKKLKLSSEPFEFKLSSLTVVFSYSSSICVSLRNAPQAEGAKEKDLMVYVDFLSTAVP